MGKGLLLTKKKRIMKTIKITPEWVLEKLSHTLDTDRSGNISVYTGNATDANWIELALNSLEISFEAYDYLNEHNDLVFGFDFRIEDIEIECPNLYWSACEIERSKNGSRQISRNVDCGIHEIDHDKVESESATIIQEFKELNEIEHITEEELTNLFSESTLYPNYYWDGSVEYFTYFSISDYEYFQLKNGYNPFTDEFHWDFRADYYILEGVDTIDDSDVFHEIAWTDKNLTYEQALEQLSLFEREFLIMDEYYNLQGSGIFDYGENPDEYYKLLDPNYEYEFMKVEEPIYNNDGEIECFPEWSNDYIDTVQQKERETMPIKLVKKKDWNNTSGYRKARERINRLNKLLIIKEYEEQNNIDIITDEEITNIFGESELFPAYTYDDSKDCFEYWVLSDYQYLTLLKEEKRHNSEEYFCHIEHSFDLGEAECLSEGEYYFELNSELETKMPGNIEPPGDLNPELIRRAIEKSNLKYWDDSAGLGAEESIAIMLKITFFFKQIVEKREEPYASFCRKMGDFDSSMIEINEFDQISDIGLSDIYCISDLLYIDPN